MRKMLAAITVAAMCLLSLLPPVSTARAQVDTLTSTFEPGVSAQISNYSVEGNVFCFTITNTSSPDLSVAISDIGFSLEGSVEPGDFTLTDPVPNFSLLTGQQMPRSLLGGDVDFSLSVPATGIVPGTRSDSDRQAGILPQPPTNSRTFCVHGDFGELTAEQIARSLRVYFLGGDQRQVFSGTCGLGRTFETSFVEGFDATVRFRESQSGELCFTVTNNTEDLVFTGIGFDIPEEGGTFTATSIHSGFNFTAAPGPIPQFETIVFAPGEDRPAAPQPFARKLDFAFTTGRNFASGSPQHGIKPGETGEFCLTGGDASLFTFLNSLTNDIFIRYQGGVITSSCNGNTGAGGLASAAGTRPD